MKFIAVAMLLIISCVAFESAYEQEQDRTIRRSRTTLTAQSTSPSLTSDPSQYLAFVATRTSTTRLTFFQYATSNLPSNIGVGSNPQIITPITGDISAGSGTAYLYFDTTTGNLILGYNTGTITCSGICNATSGITGFPNHGLPIASWSYTSGTWDSSGGISYAPQFSKLEIQAGSGGTVTYTGPNTVVIGSTGGGGGGYTCDTNTVPYTSLAVAATTTEVTLISGLTGATMYGPLTLSETTQFAGTPTALTLSIGRTGTNNYEMTGILVPFMLSSGDANFWQTTPTSPTLSGTYNLVMSAISTGANLNGLTAGVATWKICHF